MRPDERREAASTPHDKHVEITASDEQGEVADPQSCRWAYLFLTAGQPLRPRPYELDLEIRISSGLPT